MLKKVSKKLAVTRRKVSKRWKEYRQAKSEVYRDESLSEQDKKFEYSGLLKKTYKKISGEFEGYRGFKYAALHKSDISEFKLSKKYSTVNTNQFFYKARSGYEPDDLDKLIPKILERKNVPGVVVVLKVRNTETDMIFYSSDFFTKILLNRLKQQNKSIYEYLADKIEIYLIEFELISIHIRIIYEKAKKS
jgi:hypothetical protein